LDEPPSPEKEPSFSELTAQLVEQAAALAGDRIGTGIKVATAWATRAFILGGLGLVAIAVGLTFLSLAVGYTLRMAPEASRWWICLVVAGAFTLLGVCLTILAFRGQASETKGRGEEDPR